MIDAIATDHAPHSIADKEIEFDLAAPGISSLETAFGLTMELVQSNQIELPTLIERFTSGPVRAWRLDQYPGLEGLGSLSLGAVGDVSILDPDAKWTVDPDDFASMGKNTPIAGRELSGRVITTVLGGNVVHSFKDITV